MICRTPKARNTYISCHHVPFSVASKDYDTRPDADSGSVHQETLWNMFRKNRCRHDGKYNGILKQTGLGILMDLTMNK